MPNTESNSSGSTPPCTAMLPPTWNRLNRTRSATPSASKVSTNHGGINRLPAPGRSGTRWAGPTPSAAENGSSSETSSSTRSAASVQVSGAGSVETARSCSRRIAVRNLANPGPGWAASKTGKPPCLS